MTTIASIFAGKKERNMVDAAQARINKYFFALFVFTLLFCILFYKIIGFDYTDELTALSLFLLFLYAMYKVHDWHFNKAFLITLAAFFFFLVYSFRIGSNTPRGIINDFAIQIKPYLGFFCAYQLKPSFNASQKRILRDICVLFWAIFLLPLGIISLVYPKVFIPVMEHPVYYGIAVTIIAICYLHCTDFTRRNRIIFLILLSAGLFCTRAKFYGFYTMAFFVILYFSTPKQFKLDAKTVLILICMVVLMGVVAWEKISLYFYGAMVNAEGVEKDMLARFVLYYMSPQIAIDYFPFGSGFASYATFSSGQWYSDIYVKYGIDNVWGMSKSHPNFLSDTYYPSLVQFGVAGIFLFIQFWAYIIRRACRFYRQSGDIKSAILILLTVGFLLIECTTGSTLIAQGGFMIMMFLGAVLAGMKSDSQNQAAPLP
jgi:hypothetical protein